LREVKVWAPHFEKNIPKFGKIQPEVNEMKRSLERIIKENKGISSEEK
jgi:hypothetical protein